MLPGHTDETTLAREWEENPFVRAWRGVQPEGTEPCRVGGEEAGENRLTGSIAAGKLFAAGGRENHRTTADKRTQETTQQTVHRNHRSKRSRKKRTFPGRHLDARRTD